MLRPAASTGLAQLSLPSVQAVHCARHSADRHRVLVGLEAYSIHELGWCAVVGPSVGLCFAQHALVDTEPHVVVWRSTFQALDTTRPEDLEILAEILALSFLLISIPVCGGAINDMSMWLSSTMVVPRR